MHASIFEIPDKDRPTDKGMCMACREAVFDQRIAKVAKIANKSAIGAIGDAEAILLEETTRLDLLAAVLGKAKLDIRYCAYDLEKASFAVAGFSDSSGWPGQVQDSKLSFSRKEEKLRTRHAPD
jgi:hypothetical protein